MRCQSVALPSSARYWHMGATTRRFSKVTLRREIGENSWLTGVSVGRWRARDSSDALLEGKDAMAAKVSVGEMNRIMREEVPMADRKSVVWGKSVSCSVDFGGRRRIKKK